MSCRSWLAVLFFFLAPASAATPSLFGEIFSPNYPQGYPNDVLQSWDVTVPVGYGIRIYFTHLDIERSMDCEYDSVKLVIGDEVEATLCGDDEPSTKKQYYFPSSSLTVKFQSDFSNQQRYTGFAAYYAAEDVDECEDQPEEACSHFCNNFIGGYFCSCPPEYFLHKDNRTCGVNCSRAVYTDLKGELMSPNYPNPYPENSRCEYHIQLETGYQIVVVFQSQDFDVEQHEDGSCAYDSLIVRANGRTFGPFCGSRVPSPSKIETQSNAAEIIFQTDSGGKNKGWKIRYHEDAIPCPDTVTPDSRLEPQQQKYVFKDVVKVICLKGYEVVVENEENRNSFQTECLGNGRWSHAELSCQPVKCIPPTSMDIFSAEVRQLSGTTDFPYESEIHFSCKAPYYRMVSRGNGVYRCSADGEWENRDAGTELPKCVPVCGVPSTPLGGTGRIFGGQRAKDGMFPWQVFFENPRGGGALISDQWVMTAAHVVENEDIPTMFAGVLDLIKRRPGHGLHSAKVVIHPEWKAAGSNTRTDYNNDIALIKLKTRVELGPLVSPICLPGRDPEYILQEGKLGYISGWGRKEDADKVRILHMAQIPVVKMEACQSQKPEIGESSQYVFSENMICAGGKGKDSCNGDSGGAFAVPDPHNDTLYYAAGLVSWGPECGTYGLYTNVEKYQDWIEETLRKYP